MQPRQPGSWMRQPAISRLIDPSFEAMFSSTWRLPGFTWNVVSGWLCLPFMIFATTMRSLKDEFTLLPTITWSTFMPATSLTFITFPGDEGQAMSGSIEERSISSC